MGPPGHLRSLFIRESIKRYLEALRKTVRETNSFKRLVESEKLAESEEGETINGWNEGIDDKLADIEVTKLESWISVKERAEEFAAQEVWFDVQRKIHEKRLLNYA